MKIMDFARKRRGFTAAEVLTSLLIVGVIISIFVGLNNFEGVKREESEAKLASFQTMIADIHTELREDDIKAENACDAEFLKNYYLGKLGSGATELEGYKIDDQEVTAIKVPGYGVLAILPNEDTEYCKKNWENEVLNTSEPPVVFVAISEDVASASYELGEIDIDDKGNFTGIRKEEEVLSQIEGNGNVLLAGNQREIQYLDTNTPREDDEFICRNIQKNNPNNIWGITSDLYKNSQLEHYKFCENTTPFYNEQAGEYCCNGEKWLFTGHYSMFSSDEGCKLYFCEGDGFKTKEAVEKYKSCVNGDKNACLQVEIKDTGKINRYCFNGKKNYYDQCDCPSKKPYWVDGEFFLNDIYDYDGQWTANGSCVDDCTKFENEKGVNVRLVLSNDGINCKCPSNMKYIQPGTKDAKIRKDSGRCVCKETYLVYNEQSKNCFCPTAEDTAEYNKLIDTIKKENRARAIKKVYSPDIEKNCMKDCEEGEVSPDGIHCTNKPCEGEGFTVFDEESTECICPIDVNISGNTVTHGDKTITLSDNEIYNKDNPNECKSTCTGNLKPNSGRNDCICEDTQNFKSYEFYTGDKNKNCVYSCNEKFKKAVSNGNCECHDTPQEAIAAVKEDNNTLSASKINEELTKFELKGFNETGNSIYKYDANGNTIAKWNKEKASCMEACPDAAECARRGQNDPDHIWLVDPLRCDCKVIDPDPDCEKNPEICPDEDDCAEKCVSGEIAIYDTETLLSIGKLPQYPSNGHYCLIQTINIDTSTIENPKLKENLNTLLPLTPNGFAGTFKGQGYKITGLNLNINNNNKNLGLFSKITEVDEKDYNPECPTVHSVTNLIIDGTINAGNDCSKNDYAGILTAQNTGDINQTKVTGSVTGCQAGGLAGLNDENGTIQNSFVAENTSVTGKTCAGGFVSENTGLIKQSYVKETTTSAETQAGGFVCKNTGEQGINHSYVNKGNVLANNAAGFVSINSGKIESTFVENEIIGNQNTNKAGGFANTNSKNITNAYVYDISLQGKGVAGFINTNNSTVTNVYAILKNYTGNASKILFSENNVTTTNTINSYFAKNYTGNISVSLSVCNTNGECSLDEQMIRTIEKTGNETTDEFSVTPSNDMYKEWLNTVWDFSCCNRALLKDMPAGAPQQVTNCNKNEPCPLRPTACETTRPRDFITETYEYYDINNYPSCKSTCTIDGVAINNDFIQQCAYLKAGNDNTCQCFDTSKEATNAVNNTAKAQIEALNLQEITIPKKYLGTQKDETREVIIGEEGLPVKYWDKTNPNNKCLSECPTLETCDGTLVPEWCLCIPPDIIPTECKDFDKAIMIKDTQALQSIGNLSAYPSNANYCIVNTITFTPSNVTNPALLTKLKVTDEYEEFIPLPKFTGTIEGGNHAIKKLKITDDISSVVGMITTIGNGGTVRNLDIEEANIIGLNDQCTSETGFAGILAGQNDGTINNVNVTGSVTSCNAGGIVGFNGGTIQNSSVKNITTLLGSLCAGGFVSTNNGTITKSYVSGADINNRIKVETDASGGFQNAGGFVCINNENGKIDYSYVNAANITADISAGFASTNSGTIDKAYVESENIIVNGEKSAAGFTNTNSNTIKDVYVYNINLTGTNVAGFVNSNTSTVTNVYAILKDYSKESETTPVNSNIIFTVTGTKQDVINSYFAKTDGSNIASLSACKQGESECRLTNEDIVREESDLHHTPSLDVYNTWETDTWCFRCEDRALLKGMPNSKLDESSCKTNECSAPCPQHHCEGKQQPTGAECECSCDGVAAQEAYAALSSAQKPWYADPPEHDENGYMCLKCGSYIPQGSTTALFDYVLITEGENAGYCGCPDANSLPTGYLTGYNYVPAGAKDKISEYDCREKGICNIDCGNKAIDKENCKCVEIPVDDETGEAKCPGNSIVVPGNDDEAKAYYKAHVELSEGENRASITVPTNSEEILSKIGNDEEYPADEKYCLLGNIGVTEGLADKAHVIPEFKGEFYGADFTISKIKINTVNSGLFDNNSGKIQNLTVSGSVGSTNNMHCDRTQTYSGLLAGQNSGTLTNVHATNSTVIDCNVGGLVGKNVSGTIENASVINTESSAAISGLACAGGLAAENSGIIKLSYVKGANTSAATQAGGFVCKNINDINHSFVNGGTVIANNSAGFAGENSGSGKINATYVENTEITVNDTNNSDHISAGYTVTNNGTINDAYVYDITLNGGTAIGFVSDNQSNNLKNVYVVIKSSSTGKSLSGFAKSISDESYAPTNSYWVGEKVTNACKIDTKNICKNKTNKRTRANLASTPSDDMYTDWSTNIWCFSCNEGARAILKGMPEEATALHDPCKTNECSNGLCGPIVTPSREDLTIRLHMNSEGLCVCPEDCSEFVNLEDKYNQFTCDDTMKSQAQDVDNNKFCLKYKCTGEVSAVEGYNAPTISQVYNETWDYMDGNEGDGCGCPEPEAFKDYLRTNTDLSYDENWMQNNNMSCLKPDCGELEWDGQKCTCPNGSRSVYIDGKGNRFTYITDDKNGNPIYLYENEFTTGSTFGTANRNCQSIGAVLPTQEEAQKLIEKMGSDYYGKVGTWTRTNKTPNNYYYCNTNGNCDNAKAISVQFGYWCVFNNPESISYKNGIECLCPLNKPSELNLGDTEVYSSSNKYNETDISACKQQCSTVQNVQLVRDIEDETKCVCPVSANNNYTALYNDSEGNAVYRYIADGLYLYDRYFNSGLASFSTANSKCAELGGEIPNETQTDILYKALGKNYQDNNNYVWIAYNSASAYLWKNTTKTIWHRDNAERSPNYWCVATADTVKQLEAQPLPAECNGCPLYPYLNFKFKEDKYHYDRNAMNQEPYCQSLCPNKNGIQMVRDKDNINNCVCPNNTNTFYEDNLGNKFIYIGNTYMYSKKSDVLSKEEAEQYCQSVGSNIPTVEQLSKAKEKLGRETIGVSWVNYMINVEETKNPTWCFANEDKIKELQEQNNWSCSDGCPIQCDKEDALDTEECFCDDGFTCPNYDALYVIRYKEQNLMATLYDQFSGQATDEDLDRNVSEHFKQIAEKLSLEDKNKKFDKFHAYIVGVTYDEENKVNFAEVVAAFSPRVWYYKFTAELAEQKSVPLNQVKGTNNYDNLDPNLIKVKCKNEQGGYNEDFITCAKNGWEIVDATCKSQSEVAPYILGYKYDNKVSTCRGAKNASGTGDYIGSGMHYINNLERSSDCVQLCKDDGLDNNEDCLKSCQDVVMVENIFAGCTREFCTGGSISLEPGCPPIGVDETFRRYSSPLILDLLGDGYKFTSVENGVRFDLDADGIAEQVAWTDFQKEFDDAFLWYDKNNDGKILNGKELFGDQNGAKNGFYELAKYDKNKDNVINKDDAIYEKLQLWVDFNKNAKIDKGETKTLSEAGVIEIPLEFDIVRDKDGNIITDEHGNVTGIVGKFKQLIETIVNGIKTLIEKIGTMIDVFFASN